MSGKQKSIDDKENTPAPGAEGTSENTATDRGAAGTVEQSAGVILEAQTPEWVAELLVSHKAVLESNQAVLKALDSFHEGVAEFKNDSSDFVKSLVQEFGPKKDGEATITRTYEPEFNADATYKVTSGFSDKDNMSKKYEAGDDVSHFGEARIKALLALGLVTEVEEDPED